MEEAEAALGLAAEALPIGANSIKHYLVADDVGAHEGTWIGDRAIDLALGGQMHHRIRPEVGE